jgi:phytoene synthase
VTDAEICADIARRNARTFALAASLLPRDKRRGTFALYAFCRTADDIVDAGHDDPAAVHSALDAHRRALDATYAGAPPGALFREVAWTAETFGVPKRPLEAVVAGVARDLAPSRYATWAELEVYCAGVASTVGEMCTHVFGVEGSTGREFESALRRARILGVAMQLTNILRDVGEDAARGRCYLPDEDLHTWGFTREEVLTDPFLGTHPDWRGLMQFQIVRARRLYRRAHPGIALLAADARQCASACATGYAAILDAIERQAYDTIRSRAVVPSWQKASLLWNAWRLRPARAGA